MTDQRIQQEVGRIIVTGYTGVCFEIKFSGRHIGFGDILLNLRPLTNTGLRDAWPPVVCAGRSSMALFTRTAKLNPGAHDARCAKAKAVHHAVGITRQRNRGYRPSTVNVMSQSLSTLDPSLSPTHLSG